MSFIDLRRVLMSKLSITMGALIVTVILSALPTIIGSNQGPSASLPASSLGYVKIHNATGDRWVAWESKEAIKFSLDQVVTTIHYLFAAAAAGMAFVGKIVIEPHATSSTTARVLPHKVLYLLVAGVAFWLGSLTCGMVAHLYLAEIGTAETFSIYGTLGLNVLFQLVYFGTGLALFLAALIYSIQ